MFLYVFTEEDRDSLIELGYHFINAQKNGNIKCYVFRNDNKLKFDSKKIMAYKTNKLKFA